LIFLLILVFLFLIWDKVIDKRSGGIEDEEVLVFSRKDAGMVIAPDVT
jgi:hypothetical protein